MPNVSPQVLIWARETAGLSIGAAAHRLGIRNTKALGGDERLKALEEGKDEPTQALLVKMAKTYRRPLLAFYMTKPPRKAERGRDFRTLLHGRTDIDEGLLDALLRDMRMRQSMIRSLMEQEDEAVRVEFVGSVQIAVGVRALAAKIRNSLGISLVAFRELPDAAAAFSYLRDAVEKTGVFVLLAGDLGSHRSALDVDTFRGIALADEFAPVIVINDRDAKTAWSFSLLHELAHLWLGYTGVSGAWAQIATEQFCNDVASEILLPSEELGALPDLGSHPLEAVKHFVTRFAGERNVSNSMVAYRLMRSGVLDESKWHTLQDLFQNLWSQQAAAQKAKNRESEGGPSYFTVRQHRVGKHLIEFVARMLHDGAISTSKAGRVLGIKPSNVHPLIDAVQ